MVLITQSNNSLPGRLSHALWGGGSGGGREKCCTIFIFQLHNRITSCSRRESTEGTFFEQISQEAKAAAAAAAAAAGAGAGRALVSNRVGKKSTVHVHRVNYSQQEGCNFLH